MASILNNMKRNIGSSKSSSFRKELTTKHPNGLRKDISYRPTSKQLTLIESHNNEAIRSGKFVCLSDGEEDSGLEYEQGYRRRSIGLSSDDSDTSSDDEGYERNKMVYEQYDPDMFENDETEDRNKMSAENSDNDDCTFGQSTKKHILREILHNGVEIRPNIIDDFGGWDTSFTIRNSKPLKSNTQRCSKILRTTSAFPRPSTEPKENSYLFRHYDDISEYIKQYRQGQIVKDNWLKPAKDGEEGMLIPDPYATKLKSNMCSIAENCDFFTVYSSNTREKLENRAKEKESAKEKSPSVIIPRPRPSSLVYCPSRDSDSDGQTLRQQRPSSLIYYPKTDTRSILPSLRPLSYVYKSPKDSNTRPVIVTSIQRPKTSAPVMEKLPYPVRDKTNQRIPTHKQRPSSSVIYRVDISDMTTVKQTVRQQRPHSDQPFVVRTLSVRDRSRMLNLAPVRNQEPSDLIREYRQSSLPSNMSLDHYLNLVSPNRQIRRSNSNLTANRLCNVDEKEDAKDKKTALHKKNIQLDIEGPCDPWTPQFEMKRSMSRGSISPYKPPNSAGYSRKRATSTPEATTSKQWPNRSELTLSRAGTYHSHMRPKSDTIDKELSVNSCSTRSNPSIVQRVYGQRFRCCQRIHALISSDNEESMKKSKDKHIKLSVDNLKTDKINPVSFGSFGIRKGMTREDTSVSLACMYKLKRERQRRFNISLVK